MVSKKEARKKYFDVENWDIGNRTQQLDDVKQTYTEVKKKTDDLTQRAMDLKESHESGAIDSINRASKVSEEASVLIDSVESKLNAELKPVLSALKQKLDSSKESFDKSDKELKDYYKSVMTNLTNAMNDVSFLNEAVCGEQTSDSNRCSAKCGGVVCDGKCGTNSSSCSGLADSYYKVINARQNFEELYNKQEQVFKRILTKLRNSSNLLNNANKDVNQLMEYTNKSLQSINMKQKDLMGLVKTIENFTNFNSEKSKNIETVIFEIFMNFILKYLK